jgi:hypothetical protein
MQVKIEEMENFSEKSTEERKAILDIMFKKVQSFVDDITLTLRITNKDVEKITERITKYRDVVIEQYEKRDTPVVENIIIERPHTLDYISKDIYKDEVVKTKIEKVQFNQKMKKAKTKKI